MISALFTCLEIHKVLNEFGLMLTVLHLLIGWKLLDFFQKVSQVLMSFKEKDKQMRFVEVNLPFKNQVNETNKFCCINNFELNFEN